MPNVLQLARLPVYPPTNGRERRIWETSRKLSEFGEVVLATPGQNGEPSAGSVTIMELSNPLLATKTGYVHSWNATLVFGRDNPYDRLQAWLTRRNLDAGFDLVVCESPQMLRAGLRVARDDGASLLVNKHNASHEILRQFLDGTPVPGPLVRRAVRSHAAHEQWGIDVADAVVFQSDADRERFDCPADTLIRTIPNGTGVDEDPPAAAVADLRRTLDIDSETFTCVFVGSYDYGPNRRAAETIDREIAPQLPDIEFLLVGRDPPPVLAENVTSTGFVDDLTAALSLADAALCPLQEGSGTKLKMMDYLAAGLPVITTPVGASGIDLTDGGTALVRDSPAAFVEAIQELADSPDLVSRLGRNASGLGEQYTWDRLMANYDELLTALLDDGAQRLL